MEKKEVTVDNTIRCIDALIVCLCVLLVWLE